MMGGQAEVSEHDRRRAEVRARCWAAKRTAMPPSPAAGATILVDPERTSPTANTPGRLVSTSNGSRPSVRHGSRWPRVGAEPRPGKDESLVVQCDLAGEPFGARLGAD